MVKIQTQRYQSSIARGARDFTVHPCYSTITQTGISGTGCEYMVTFVHQPAIYNGTCPRCGEKVK